MEDLLALTSQFVILWNQVTGTPNTITICKSMHVRNDTVIDGRTFHDGDKIVNSNRF